MTELRVLSLNVLLPNSVRGWWIAKMYSPGVPAEHRAWPHRQELLSRLILEESPDLVCLQEMCPDSFASDFAFLEAAGYASLLHRKFELRVATFWRPERFTLKDSRHLDRVLVTTFDQTELQVVNCHLTAGPHPDRRLRQVHEAIERLDPRKATLVCGDFNSPARSGLHELLERAEIDPSWRDADQPELALTSRVRRHPHGPMRDAYADQPDPTFVVTRHRRQALLEALPQMYALFQPWDGPAIERWLRTINGASDRGREAREVERLLEGKPRQLSFAQLVEIYLVSLSQGAPWALAHDLHVCGLPVPAPAPSPFEARLDYLYYSQGLELLSRREPCSADQLAALRRRGAGLPDAEYPSDHLPLRATFRLSQRAMS